MKKSMESLLSQEEQQKILHEKVKKFIAIKEMDNDAYGISHSLAYFFKRHVSDELWEVNEAIKALQHFISIPEINKQLAEEYPIIANNVGYYLTKIHDLFIRLREDLPIAQIENELYNIGVIDTNSQDHDAKEYDKKIRALEATKEMD